MTDKRFYWLASASLLAIVIMTFLGAAYESVNVLFNVLLAVVGILAGFITNRYFADKSDRQNLGQYAAAGYRLSVNIYDSLKDTIETIEQLQRTTDDESNLSKKDLQYMLAIISGQLRVLQRISLSGNDSWKDVLPREEVEALTEREKWINLSEEKELRWKEKSMTYKGTGLD